jgi:ubiquitin-conjugating enzyme E2 J1
LSISAYHEETWQPAWGGEYRTSTSTYAQLVLDIVGFFPVVRTMLEALISFMPTDGMGAIGALDWTAEERKKLAIEVSGGRDSFL